MRNYYYFDGIKYFPLIAAALCLISGCNIQHEPTDQKPNLLIVQTDEHNSRTLGCYRVLMEPDQANIWGAGVNVETPHIDWLAQNGGLFSKCYASTPVCSPSRGSFVSGLYPQHTGVTSNNLPMFDSVVTFAEILKDAGYFTAYLGKWHLDGQGKPQWAPERKFGFQDNRYMYNRGHWKKLEDGPLGPRIASLDKDGNPNYYLDGADETSFSTDFLTNRAIRIISENKNSPFCVMLSIPDPHGPDRVRAPYDEMFRDLPFEAPKSFHKSGDGVPSWAEKQTKAAVDQSQYFGMVKCIDDNVGKLINYLEKEGLLENTILVFTADHGDLRAEHHRHNKGVPLEASAKIPMIVYAPSSIKAGTVINNAMNTVDFAPTILALMQIHHQSAMQGVDFSKILVHPEQQKSARDMTFVRSTGLENDGKWIGVFTGRYKLILSKNDDPWLLDLELDPDELQNYINNPENESIVKKLAFELQKYGRDFEDPYLQNTKMSNDLENLIQ